MKILRWSALCSVNNFHDLMVKIDLKKLLNYNMRKKRIRSFSFQNDRSPRYLNEVELFDHQRLRVGNSEIIQENMLSQK